MEEFLIGVCVVFVACCIGGCGFGSGVNHERRNAVLAGVGEWTYTTNDLGQLSIDGFRYKTNSIKGIP